LSDTSTQTIPPHQGAESIDWQIRPLNISDVPGVVALVNSVYDAYGIKDSLSEAMFKAYLDAPRSDPARQRVVVDGPRIPGIPSDIPIGSGGLRYEEDEETDERMYYINMTVHPAAEGMGLEQALARKIMDIVREHESDPNLKRMTKVTIKGGFLEPMSNKRVIFQAMGLKEVRQFWTMARPLDEPIDEPAHVDGIIIHPFNYPADSEGARAAFNDSFSDHWDHHPIGQADWEHWMSQDLMRPDLSLLADVESSPGTIAGFCLISIIEADNKRRGVCEGWIDLLGTTRDWRRVGLGRALILHGLHSLKNAGMETALLGVDSTSPTGAQRLYESVGFRTRVREFAYEAQLGEVTV
jgi:mycothiol synthase